jgi:glutamyl-tRNA reductase
LVNIQWDLHAPPLFAIAMTLFALGINHTTASVDLREAVAFSPEQLTLALAQAREHPALKELAILSTCNRTELYADVDGDGSVLLQWLAQFHSADSSALADCHYLRQGMDAARHMMQVASGLDSLVLGEPQILGQMKSAYACAVDAKSIGSQLHNTFHKVFSVAKRVRSETAIGENPVSVAYAAVSLAQQIFSDLKQDTALLIGAGETIELVARHLVEAGIKKIIVANRTLVNAVELASQFNGDAILLSDIPEHLARADIIIASTASQLPILGKGAVEAALKKRRHKPMFMVDIAVPRDIEPQVADLADVFLYTVDDLKIVIDENMRSREQAAEIAREIIEESVIHYEQELKALDAKDLLLAYRQAVESARDAELSKALKALQAGQSAEEILQMLARNLTNKFLHKPSAALKQASSQGNYQFLNDFQNLLDLSLEKALDKPSGTLSSEQE